MNLLAWSLGESEGIWLFALLLPILLMQARYAGDEAGAKLVLGVLAGTTVVILIFAPALLISMIAFPAALIVLIIGWLWGR